MLTRKIMLLGEIAVGKTSLARRLVFDTFDTGYKATLGVDIYSCDLPANGECHQEMRLMIWDIDGDFSESIFNHIYIRGASGALVIGDLARPATLETMIRLADGFRETLPGRPIAFVANKADLLDAGRRGGFPDGLHDPEIPLFETSAMSGDNVADAFAGLGAAIVRAGV